MEPKTVNALDGAQHVVAQTSGAHMLLDHYHLAGLLALARTSPMSSGRMVWM